MPDNIMIPGQDGGNSLIRKLAAIVDEIDHVDKRGRNEFQRYNYVKAADLANLIRSKLSARNLYMVSDVVGQRNYEIPAKEGVMQAVDVNILYTIHDADSGETIAFHCPGTGTDKGDKAIYKALTGSLKYALRNAFLVPDESDPEADEKTDRAVSGSSKPDHREGNEHFSNSCKECQAANVPRNLKAVLSHGRIYVKTLHDVALEEIYTESAGPLPPPVNKEPAGPGVSKEAPSHSHPESKPGVVGDMKEFMGSMGTAKLAYPNGIGAENYYRILGLHGVEHANEVKKRGDRQKLRDDMTECYRDMKNKTNPTFPEEHTPITDLVKEVIAKAGVSEKPVMEFCKGMVNGGTRDLKPQDENITRTILQGLLKDSPDEIKNRLSRYK